MLSEFKWLSINDRVNFPKMCLVYKCRNGLVPQYPRVAETFSNIIMRISIIPESKLANA